MILGLDIVPLSLLMLFGLVLDGLLGEVRFAHPLVGFGRYANWIEARLNRGPARVARGLLAWMLAVLAPLTLTVAALFFAGKTLPLTVLALHAVLLYFCIGLRSLRDHCLPIATALRRGDLAGARCLTQRIVSRDTAQADAQDLSKAAVESLLENGNDAVFGTLFWFLIAGGPGALLFRLANTLDAMWGYRNARFLLFGRVAARLDDGLNWIPARLTAFTYLLLGDSRAAWQCWRTQAPAWPSPNAGPVMASGAGALQLALGGAATYDGMAEMRPPLGSGRLACCDDIERAWRLVSRSAALWCCTMIFAALIVVALEHHA